MRRSSRLEGIASSDLQLAKTEAKAVTKLISAILKKDLVARTTEELETLQKHPGIVTFLCKRSINNKLVKEREQEVEDVASELEAKCKRLASILEESRSLVIYTGAGISTAASIPDYRGPQGVWTLLKQGKECRTADLSLAQPTYTHMAIVELYRKGYVKRVVSQNCDGLHLRSGLPRSALSELHGNMFLEVCRNCQPTREYLRLFDVTERTGMRRHKTGRVCYKCKSPLLDTIIHFGEKSPFQSPHNWQQATNAANKADVVLCLGTSLKVLKKYACLWATHKPLDEQPRLVVVNLQWTPKDKRAELKINGKCDDVMKSLTKYLGMDIPLYDKHLDPLFHLSTSLLPHELDSTSKAILPLPNGFVQKSAEDLRVRTQRRKFALKSASMQSEGDEETVSSYDEDSLASFMQSHYHIEEGQGEIRRQPARLAKIKQFFVQGKRRSVGDTSENVPRKFLRVEETENTLASELSPFVTPSSSRSNLLVDDIDSGTNNEKASQDLESLGDQFTENSYDIQAELSSVEDTSESCYSIPQDAAEGRTLSEEHVSFSICSSMTPPPSNESIDSQSNDPLFNSLITFDCDYASIEEVISACDGHGIEVGQKDKVVEEVPSLVTPGWFGKGVQMKKIKRKRIKKLK